MKLSNENSFNFKLVEFFCGAAEVSKAFKTFGFETFTIDRRNRKGKCVPDLCADILKIYATDIPIKQPGIIWAAVPCDAFSNAAGNYYRDGTGYKESTKYFNSLLRKTIRLIEEMSPAIYFIENPRGSLRYNKLMIDFLARTGGTIKECTLGSYGFPTTKPTDIFTNYTDLKLKKKLQYGRGAKCTTILGNDINRSFNNLTKSQRQCTPFELGIDIARQLCETFPPIGYAQFQIPY